MKKMAVSPSWKNSQTMDLISHVENYKFLSDLEEVEQTIHPTHKKSRL